METAGSAKISEILGVVYTDSSLKHVLNVLDERTGTSGRPSERNVRSQAEQDYLDQTALILSQMQPLSSSLERLGRQIRKVCSVHEQMRALLAHAHGESAAFAQEARFLFGERAALQTKLATADAYIDAFHVTEHERRVLEDPAVPLNDEFLGVLERIKTIQSQCAVLLLAEAPAAGEFLMLETTKLLDSAYAKIRTVIEAQLRQDASTNLRKYMALLTERPLLFKSVLLGQAGARRQQLSSDFTRFIAVEQPNAGIMPLRYLGSVLAWVHAAIVNEYEHISLLLDPGEETIGGEASTQKTLEQLLSTTDTRVIVTELVDSVIASVETPLRQKINAVIVAQTSPVVVDELQSVLLFYGDMLAKYEQPTLTALFEQLDQSLDRQFEHCLQLSGGAWDTAVDTARAVLTTYDEGVLRQDARTRARLDLVLDTALSEVLRTTQTDNIKRLNMLDLAVLRLAGFIVAQPKLDELRRLEAECEAKQATEEVQRMKRESHLDELVVGAMQPAAFFAQFDAFLAVANTDLQHDLEPLNSPTMAHRISTVAITRFIDEYEFAVKDLDTPRSAEEIRTLLL